jgi:hypothetical protein
MANSEGQLDATLVESTDNVAETAAAFEAQSQQFKQVQNQFEDYMDRLQDDIRLKGEKFGHVEYYDAKLRDGHSNEEAVAASEVNQLDSRRKPLATANPLLAKQAELPPTPHVEEITFEYLNLDLPSIAEKALSDLEDTSATPPAEPTPEPEPEPVQEEVPEQPTDEPVEEPTAEENNVEDNQ